MIFGRKEKNIIRFQTQIKKWLSQDCYNELEDKLVFCKRHD